jgi:hypothetical protein
VILPRVGVSPDQRNPVPNESKDDTGKSGAAHVIECPAISPAEDETQPPKILRPPPAGRGANSPLTPHPAQRKAPPERALTPPQQPNQSKTPERATTTATEQEPRRMRAKHGNVQPQESEDNPHHHHKK